MPDNNELTVLHGSPSVIVSHDAASTESVSMSLTTLSLLIFTPIIIAVGQVLFKLASQHLVASPAGIVQLALQPTFIAGVLLYGIATFLWAFVLKTVPLSYAYSFMALTYIMVPLLATWWFGDVLTLKYGIGVALIICGLLVAQS